MHPLPETAGAAAIDPFDQIGNDAEPAPTALSLQAAMAEIAELRRAVELREAFIASIGHELRNPMVPILLSVERLRRLAEKGELARLPGSIKVLGHATDAFMRRAAQLLDLSRLGNTGFVLQPAPCDISAVIRDTLERHLEIARRAGCVLEQEIENGITGHADQTALEQLLDNLLSNAFKYGAGRPVRVTLARKDADAVELGVIDGGQGVPEDEHAHIFALFSRARAPGAPGLGIGLWICASLAAAMGGAIRVDSAPSQGAAFTLSFPLPPTGTDP